MFAVGDDLVVRAGADATLKAGDQFVDVARNMKGIFAGSFLTSTPTGVFKSMCMDAFVSTWDVDRTYGGKTNGLMLGVKKSRPEWFVFPNARASVLIVSATEEIRSSSKAALIRMGSGNEVAPLKSPDFSNVTPGLDATPCCSHETIKTV